MLLEWIDPPDELKFSTRCGRFVIERNEITRTWDGYLLLGRSKSRLAAHADAQVVKLVCEGYHAQTRTDDVVFPDSASWSDEHLAGVLVDPHVRRRCEPSVYPLIEEAVVRLRRLSLRDAAQGVALLRERLS